MPHFTIHWTDREMLTIILRIMGRGIGWHMEYDLFARLVSCILMSETHDHFQQDIASIMRSHLHIAFAKTDDLITLMAPHGSIMISTRDHTITLTHRDNQAIRQVKCEWQLTPV